MPPPVALCQGGYLFRDNPLSSYFVRRPNANDMIDSPASLDRGINRLEIVRADKEHNAPSVVKFL